ncbi:MAG: hypothetical protein C4537_05515 [Acholeplasma sp.]|jgi:cephalosporin-C deacetylase|nr:MAG: hypothetical protein C4537_05515 [Acholeplasma sp.]
MLDHVLPLEKPHDFDLFWQRAKQEIKQIPFHYQIDERVIIESFDEVNYFSYQGAKHEKIYGLELIHDTKPRPTIVFFHGYGWHKGEPNDFKDYYNIGYNVISFDIRGQKGRTKDLYPYASGDHRLMTKGIMNPEEYYLKHVYQDSLQLIGLLRTLPFVDRNHILLHGGSQGGGIVVALAALETVSYVFADVPSYTYFLGRLKGKHGSVKEIADYMTEHQLDSSKVLSNLQYFDNLHFAKSIKAPIFASVGMKDDICPAEFFEKAFNQITTNKVMYRYPEGGHEGGGAVHYQIKLKRAKEYYDEYESTT